jgi:tetratricopeptide (TPR) repeat protein
MWDLAVREDDYKAVDAMLQRFKGAPLSFRIVPAYARHDSAAIARLHEEAKNLDARQSQIAARYVATFLEDFTSAEDLARLDLQPRRNAGIRLTAQTFLAWLEIARGRWKAADRAFADAERMDGGEAVKTEHALAATLPFLDMPSADVAVLRGEIERWTPLPDVAGAPSLATALRPHLRLYILGLLAARMEDNEHAEQYARQLERLSAPAQGHGITAALAATIRADVALHARRYAEVLTLLVPVNGEVPLELVSVRPFVNTREFTQEHARYLRAEALLALGRNDEARRWLEYGFQGSPWELAYLAPVHDRLARILASSGDRQGSATHLKAFAKLWRDSDAPQLARVRAALDSVR